MDTLIEEVKKYSVLYNSELNQYRDQRMRQEAWEEIGKVLNISAEKAKENWEKLRRCFANAINRRRNHLYKSNARWRYEQKMSFLLPYLHHKKPPKNIDDESKTNPIPSQVEYEPNIYHEYLQENENSGFEEHKIIVEETDKESSKMSHFTIEGCRMNEEVCFKNQTETMRSFEDATEEETENKTNFSKSSRQIYENVDEIDLFFLSMSRMTKKLPKIEQVKIKLAVSNTVLQAELKQEEMKDNKQETTTSGKSDQL